MVKIYLKIVFIKSLSIKNKKLKIVIKNNKTPVSSDKRDNALMIDKRNKLFDELFLRNLIVNRHIRTDDEERNI